MSLSWPMHGHVQNCDHDFRFPSFSTCSWLPDKKKIQALAEMRHSLKPPLGLNQTVKMISTVSTEVTIYKLNFTKICTVTLPFDRCKSVTKLNFHLKILDRPVVSFIFCFIRSDPSKIIHISNQPDHGTWTSESTDTGGDLEG